MHHVLSRRRALNFHAFRGAVSFKLTEGTDAEIEAMSLQKMKAALLSTWDDLSYRSDFDQIKGDIAEKHKGELANVLSDLLSLKEVNAEKGAPETRALFSLLSTYSFGEGEGGGGYGGGSGDDDDDDDYDPSGMHEDVPSVNEEPAKEDRQRGARRGGHHGRGHTTERTRSSWFFYGGGESCGAQTT